MTTRQEGQYKAVPESLAVVQALVNTQYGQGRYAHTELTSPEQLRAWLVGYGLLKEGEPVSEGDLRRVLQLREALRSLLRANVEKEVLTSPIGVLNHLASAAPLKVRFHDDGRGTLEPDIAGVDGALASLIGEVFTAMINGTWGRLKVCRYERCQKAFYDTSKNRSGVWCSMARCGSRQKARAYRHRSRVAQD
ncbi:CGNR zinc finger domain-containing protein [Ktedonospora formicarum]|uniref:Zinc finger CGNR domain-containing protein n=1 Tax=Ktedonospora formicarum TaxID=2778364 RepID=A0A8J3I9D4_9CHLR|nr:CGNR zinc finger domain-containing protein [Ktedonospora formicarum]GHO51051.1 hypothetical protein KSX_92140 [Ktedonospora formicarum]